VVAVRDHLGEMGDAVVAVVTFTPHAQLAGYQVRLGVPFALLSDPDRAAYQAYGLSRGSWWRVYGPRTLLRYAQLLRRGRRLERITEDTLQLGGDFVVGRDGRLTFAHRPIDPDDRPDVEDIVRAVRRDLAV